MESVGQIIGYELPDDEFAFDPSLALYLPLHELDGVSFKSKDAYGHLCTNSGTLWRPDGRYFDGDDQINIVNVLSLLAATTQGTWIVRAKVPDATPAIQGALIGFGDANAVTFIVLRWMATGKLEGYIALAGVNQWILETNAAVAADNTMVTLGLVQDGTSPVLYVNGVVVAQTFTVSTNKTRWFSALSGLDTGGLGSFSLNGNATSNPLICTEESVLIYSRAFTAGEMMEKHLAIRRG